MDRLTVVGSCSSYRIVVAGLNGFGCAGYKTTSHGHILFRHHTWITMIHGPTEGAVNVMRRSTKEVA